MSKLNFYPRIGFLVYIFFYLICFNSAISREKNNNLLKDLENALNLRDTSLINNYFEENESKKIRMKLSQIVKEFPDSKWTIKKGNNKNPDNNVFEVNVLGSKNIEGSEFVINSDFDYLYSLKNGKIKNGIIKNHLTTIRNDKNLINLEIAIPDEVLTGSNYSLDIILNDPLEEEIIAGGIKAHQEESIINQSITLEPLVSGGIFKVTRAPTKIGTQIWSGIIVHPKGLVSFTKTVDIIEKF